MPIILPLLEIIFLVQKWQKEREKEEQNLGPYKYF